jgi:hypothetical protein
VITQEEVERMAAVNNQIQQAAVNATGPSAANEAAARVGFLFDFLV